MAMVRDFDRSKPTMLCIHIYRVARARIVLPTFARSYICAFAHIRTLTYANSRTTSTAGAKLTNIFSTSFSITTRDSVAGLEYSQTWRDNMSLVEPPIVTSLSGCVLRHLS
jgi:hypothetical protein